MTTTLKITADQMIAAVKSVAGVCDTNRWTKAGKDRLYFDTPKLNGGAGWNGGKGVHNLYLDLQTGQLSRPADWAGAATAKRGDEVIAAVKAALEAAEAAAVPAPAEESAAVVDPWAAIEAELEAMQDCLYGAYTEKDKAVADAIIRRAKAIDAAANADVALSPGRRCGVGAKTGRMIDIFRYRAKFGTEAARELFS